MARCCSFSFVQSHAHKTIKSLFLCCLIAQLLTYMDTNNTKHNTALSLTHKKTQHQLSHTYFIENEEIRKSFQNEMRNWLFLVFSLCYACAFRFCNVLLIPSLCFQMWHAKTLTLQWLQLIWMNGIWLGLKWRERMENMITLIII